MQFKWHYIRVSIARLVSLASQFLLVAIIGRAAGLETLGQYGASFSLASIIAVTATFGQLAFIYRELPSALISIDRISERKILSSAFTVVLIGTTVSFVPFLGVGYYLFDSFTVSYITFLFGIVLGLLNICSAVTRCYGGVYQSELVRNANWRLLSIIAVASLYFFGYLSPLTHDEVILITVAMGSLTVLAENYRIGLFSKIFPLGNESLKKSAKVNLQSWCIQFLQAILLNSDLLLASLILSSSEVGVYFILTRLSALVATALTISNPIITPVIARIIKNEKNSELERRVVINTAFNTSSSLIAAVLLLVFLDAGYKTLSGGSELNPTHTLAFCVLVFAQVCNTCAGPTVMTAQMLDVRGKAIIVIGGALLLQCIGVYFFSSSFGVFGVATSVAVSRVLLQLSLVLLIYNSAGFNIFSGKTKRI